jgi:hypothetical protein
MMLQFKIFFCFSRQCIKQLSEFWILIMPFFLTTVSNAQNIRVNPHGPVSSLYKPGVFMVPKTNEGTDGFINNGIRHNSIRMISIELAMEFGAPSITGVMQQLEALKPGILYANSRCEKLILTFLKMPPWLSSSSDTTTLGDPNWKKFNAMPPASYATWSLLVDSVVSKINDQWGLDPYYEIWNEPDNFYWQGTPAQYFEFFNKTYFAIKKNHPTAKVGGPVLASFTSKFGSAYPPGFISNTQLDSSIIGMLIDSCIAWNAPLDFLSWHKFDSFLYSLEMEFNYLDQKLIASGHGAVPYLISEWNNSYEIRESNFAAAFMLNYVLALEQYGAAGHLVASWQDFFMDTVEFHHDYGMLSWGALHKPEWKSLLLLDKLTGTKVETERPDYLNFAAVSSIQGDTLRILLSNRSLPGYTEATSFLLYKKKYNVTDLLSAGYTSSKLDSIYRGLIILSGSDSLSIAINSVIPVYQKADSAFRYGRNINLVVSGLTGTHTGKQYLIDSTHNNVIYQFDSLLKAGYSRASATTFLYPNSTIETTGVILQDSILLLYLQPNAVILLELYISGSSGIVDPRQVKHYFKIFPNTSSESFTVRLLSQPLENEQIRVFDSMGRLVKTVNTQQAQTVINVQELSAGLYFVRLRNQQQALKFIKQ